VLAEMRAEAAPITVREWALLPPDWIEIVSVSEADGKLPIRLGAGEKEVISIALQWQAELLLMDDQPARLAAEARGLFVTGTLSVLLQASRRKRLHFESMLSALKERGFRMSRQVEATMRSLAQTGRE
jgi:predicted nucleic acid-binding protein